MKMYTNAGLVSLKHTAQSGKVVYELAIASIERLNEVAMEKGATFNKLEAKTDWKFPYPFFFPAPCYHGGAFFKAIGEDLQNLHKRKEIINADVLDAWFPPSPKVVAALQAELAWLLQTSPPTHNSGLVQAIADARFVDKQHILAGAGSSDLIFLGLQHLIHAGSKVLILDPCYGEYRHVLDHLVRCQVSTFALRKANSFLVDTHELMKEVSKGYNMLILVNPNSPTGLHVSRESMIKLLQQVPVSTLVWIDETYVEYAGPGSSLEQYAAKTTNVIICKSMSKVYALSGARAAYLCAPRHIQESLAAIAPPWSVSLPAQLAAITALQDEPYYNNKYELTHVLRHEVKANLLKLGITGIINGMANFLLFYLPEDASYSATEYVLRCRSKGLFIRDVSSMGEMLGKGALRIAIKDRDTNIRMLSIMQEALK